jgi:hypothetical protein
VFPITGCSGGDPWRTDAGGAGAEHGESDDDRPAETAADRGAAATFSGKTVPEPRSALPRWRNCKPRMTSFSWNGIFYAIPLLGWARSEAAAD